MTIIDRFVDHYNRELNYYGEVGKIIQQKLEASLLSHGIRAIVTSRPKRTDRLRDKLIKRNREKKYKFLSQIYKDIIDLSGVRVALYFPADRERVERLIQELFVEVRKPRSFPRSKSKQAGKRFIGYVATHYLVRLNAESVEETQLRYCPTNVEIQVASVLMHAWAEVEHDLVYKPDKGDLSTEELAVLDELNGMVLAGEIALERLQRAIERRTARDHINFKDQYELASYLAQKAMKLRIKTSDIGKVDVLNDVLNSLRFNTPAKVNPYLKQIAGDDRTRPIADVVLDKVLISQPKRKVQRLSKLVSKALTRSPFGRPLESTATETAIGLFLTRWIEFESLLNRLAWVKLGKRNVPPVLAVRMVMTNSPIRLQVERIVTLRNALVHGVLKPSPPLLLEAADLIQRTILPETKKLLG